MELTLELDLLAPVDWRVLREARLAALLDSPYAFTSTYAHDVNGNRKLISCRQVKIDQSGVHSGSAVSVGIRPRSRFLSR